MKKLTILLLIAGLFGCNSVSEQELLNKLESPIIVVAIGKMDDRCTDSGSITLIDGNGKLFSFGCITDIARSVSNSRQIGDTLQ